MLLYPQSIPAQSSGLSALSQVITQYPICENWILLLSDINLFWSQLSPDALRYVGQIADSTAKVLRWVQSIAPTSIPVYQYIGPLALGATRVSVAATLAAINATGALRVTLTPAATNALSSLLAWDDALGTNQPANVGQVGYVLVSGVTVGVGGEV